MGKVANAYRRGDELGLRLAAQDLARSCPSLLQPLNPHPGVGSRHAAPLAALGFAVVPPGYHEEIKKYFDTLNPAEAAAGPVKGPPPGG